MSKEDEERKYWLDLSAAQSKFERENPDPWKHPAGPLFQANAKLELEHERLRFERGQKMALMGAIRICANHDLPLPDWAARAYISAYDKVLTCRSNDWNEVFGRPYPGKHLGKLRQRRELKFAIYLRVNDLRQDGWSIEDGRRVPRYVRALDDILFEEVGEEFSIKKTLCKELYYEAKNLLPEI